MRKMAAKLFLIEDDYKSEARNPKFETISNDQIPNVQNKKSLGNLNLGNSDLFRISIFGFRIFSTRITCLVPAMPG